jgi:hypothetical protein
MTLPLVAIGFWRPKWAGLLLIISALLSGLTACLDVPVADLPQLLTELTKTTYGPMVLLGSGFLWVVKTTETAVKINDENV